MREKKKKKNRKGEAIILSRFPMNPREDWSLRKEKKGGKIYIYICVCAIKNMVLCVFCWWKIEKQKRGGKNVNTQEVAGRASICGAWERSMATKRDNILRFRPCVHGQKVTKSWERKINPSHASTLRGTHRFLSVFCLVSAWKLCAFSMIHNLQISYINLC